MILNGLPWKQTEIILSFLRLHTSTEFQTLLLTKQSAKTRPGADYGSNHEHFIAKFRLKKKEVGETIRTIRYELNQIPYDYTVEVTNRFKGLDLIDRVPEELWTGVCDTVQETGIKTIPKKKKCKSKMAV